MHVCCIRYSISAASEAQGAVSESGASAKMAKRRAGNVIERAQRRNGKAAKHPKREAEDGRTGRDSHNDNTINFTNTKTNISIHDDVTHSFYDNARGPCVNPTQIMNGHDYCTNGTTVLRPPPGQVPLGQARQGAHSKYIILINI